MNILFVHEVDYLDKPIYEIHEYPEQLARLGHEITFLEFNEASRRPKSKRSRTIAGRVFPDVQLRLETPFYTGIVGLDRILAVFTCIPKLISLLRNNKFDVIVLYAVPTYGPQTIAIAKIFGIPLFHRALDVPHKIRKSGYETLIRLAEKIVYKFSPEVSANNQGLANYCDQLGERKIKSKVHLPPLDLNSMKKAKKSLTLANSLGINQSDDVVVYLGSFFYFSGLPQVVKDFHSATQFNQNIKLLLIGGGEQDPELRTLVKKLDLEHKIIFTGFIKFDEIPKYLALANVAINPMESVISSNLALPHKVFQYLACGLPVVSTNLLGIHVALGNESGVTWVHGPSQIVGAVLELLSDPKRCEIQSEIACKTVARLFEMQKVIGDFELFLSSTIDNQEVQ